MIRIIFQIPQTHAMFMCLCSWSRLSVHKLFFKVWKVANFVNERILTAAKRWWAKTHEFQGCHKICLSKTKKNRKAVEKRCGRHAPWPWGGGRGSFASTLLQSEMILFREVARFIHMGKSRDWKTAAGCMCSWNCTELYVYTALSDTYSIWLMIENINEKYKFLKQNNNN